MQLSPLFKVSLAGICLTSGLYLGPELVNRAGAPMLNQGEVSAPVELGTVRWHRDLDAGLAEVRSTGRPLFLLFQEIPGCSTCQNFGAEPLSHPLLVEAIETEFVPVVVHNNKGGEDAKLLKRFGEPSWNNPVVRFLDADAKDLIPRQDGVWSSHGIAQRMIESLKAAEREVPTYLQLAAEELSPRLERASFAMHCFWEGEARLGALPGVTKTRAGWIGGKEVVEVFFDPGRMAYGDLIDKAREMRCASVVFAHSDDQWSKAQATVGVAAERTRGPAGDAKASDRKYHLLRSPLRFLPLTPMQATRINSELALKGEPERWLSARQVRLAARIQTQLDRDGSALKGLERPDGLADQIEHQKRLLARLVELEARSQ